jgi:hypothetical protein
MSAVAIAVCRRQLMLFNTQAVPFCLLIASRMLLVWLQLPWLRVKCPYAIVSRCKARQPLSSHKAHKPQAMHIKQVQGIASIMRHGWSGICPGTRGLGAGDPYF